MNEVKIVETNESDCDGDNNSDNKIVGGIFITRNQRSKRMEIVIVMAITNAATISNKIPSIAYRCEKE